MANDRGAGDRVDTDQEIGHLGLYMVAGASMWQITPRVLRAILRARWRRIQRDLRTGAWRRWNWR